jgi:hypothetical protein
MTLTPATNLFNLWDGNTEPIPPDHDRYGQPCDQCQDNLALDIDAAGDIWCLSCLQKSQTGIARLAEALEEVLGVS